MGTFGSRSIRYFGPPLRDAAAEARAILMGLAADHLHLEEKQLTVKNGVVMDKSDTTKQVTYAELAKGKND